VGTYERKTKNRRDLPTPPSRAKGTKKETPPVEGGRPRPLNQIPKKKARNAKKAPPKKKPGSVCCHGGSQDHTKQKPQSEFNAGRFEDRGGQTRARGGGRKGRATSVRKGLFHG